MSGEQCSVACAQEDSEKLTGDSDTGELAGPIRPGLDTSYEKEIGKILLKKRLL